ncbi:MAG: sterol desaturase family protein [Chitinophagaceae bacterium]|nr:sterol desaturase family protein [Chitinophagaceae bacterium]
MKIATKSKSNYAVLAIGLVVLLIVFEIIFRVKNFLFNNWLPGFIDSSFWRNNIAGYLGFMLTILPLVLIELVLPNEKDSEDHKGGMLFWVISIQANYFIGLLSIMLIQYLNLGPVVHLSFQSLSSGHFLPPLLLNILLIVSSLLIFDFFYYWFHRLQHTVPFFWEFHKTHHSIRNLNSVVSYHHFSEELWRIPFVALPLAILIRIDAPQLAILSSFYAFYGQFIHMNSKVSLGPLRRIFADNVYHRLHHSIEKEHYNKNFAAFFPVWDQLFGTVHFPVKDEFPKVGLEDVEQPRTIKEYLFHPTPFKKKNRSFRKKN